MQRMGTFTASKVPFFHDISNDNGIHLDETFFGDMFTFELEPICSKKTKNIYPSR